MQLASKIVQIVKLSLVLAARYVLLADLDILMTQHQKLAFDVLQDVKFVKLIEYMNVKVVEMDFNLC